MSEFWVNVFICIPVEGIWDSSVATSCIPNGPYQYVYISLDIVSAIAIFLFPIIFLRHMMIGWPEAFVLSVVFTLGLFVVVLQFVRLQYINLGSDFTWNFADRAALMISELAVAVLCTCIPLLHPLAMRFWPQWFCTIRYLNGNENNLKPPHSEDTEKVHHVQTHHHQITLGTKDASSSGLGFGLPHEVAGSRPKNRNNTPCDALDDVFGSSPRRGDSGDMSDDIMGLQSALRGLKRLSFNRSQSDGDARKLSQHRDSRELARQSPRPDMGRTRTSPYMQSPTLGWERSGSPVDLQPKNPTVAARRAKSPMQMTKGRLTPVVTSRMPSFGGNESEASLVPNYASEQQQQDRPQQQQQRHYLHPDTFYNSISDSNSSYYNKRLPPAPRHMAGGVDVYEEHYRLRRDSDKSARLARDGRL
ncbi:hypothetical protein MCOR25_005821 [Pyricularia grisea]|nr:hypothetical protein MCOR25_005821 [Pyricularia grisea]